MDRSAKQWTHPHPTTLREVEPVADCDGSCQRMAIATALIVSTNQLKTIGFALPL
jgi:hypothetical protein